MKNDADIFIFELSPKGLAAGRGEAVPGRRAVISGGHSGSMRTGAALHGGVSLSTYLLVHLV